MQADQLQQRIERIEECADEAKDAVAATQVPPDLRQCVDSLHQQARQAQQACSTQAGGQAQMGQDAVRQQIAQLEQTADRAMQACRSAGNLDPQVQQAVRRAHDEVSGLKKELQMG